MTIFEARKISLDKAGKHPVATWNEAATLLSEAGEPAMRQLCGMKAAWLLRKSDPQLGADVGN